MSAVERAPAFVEAAHAYAELGWALIRADGKQAKGEGWQRTKPDAPELAAGKWAEWGQRWNLGVVCGPSGVAVLDVDVDDDPDGAVLELLGLDELPFTPIVRTGKGRLQVYFRDPGGLEKRARGGFELRVGAHLCLAPPSVHPDTGRPYRWLEGREPSTVPLAELPAAVLAYFGAENGHRPAAPVGDRIPAGERNRTLASLAGTMRRRGMSEPAIAEALLVENASRCEPPLGEDEVRRIAESVARYAPADPIGVTAPRQHSDGSVSTLRRELHLALAYIDRADMTHIDVGAATLATSELQGDPLWIMLVAPPSSSKTEAIRAFDGVADASLDEVTPAGMLAWQGSATKGRPVGVLVNRDGALCLTIKDFSTVLAMSDRGDRDMLFALFRRAADGEVIRNLGSAPYPLVWRGRLTLLAAVTPSIDNYASHADALGPRWLYLRLDESDAAQRRRAAGASRRNARELDRLREPARAAATRLVRAARAAIPDVVVPDWFGDELDDAAIVASLGRGAVPRHGYGRREITGLPVIEEPARLAGQLENLARGLLAIGVNEHDAVAICRRAALDSMPAPRLRCLQALAAAASPLRTAGVARGARCDRKVARFVLEELAEIGLVSDDAGRDVDEDGPRGPWWLEGDYAPLVRAVLTAPRGGTKCGYLPHNPQEQGDGRGSHSSSRPRENAHGSEKIGA